MHITASPTWDSWSELLTRLPPDLDLDELAFETGAITRVRPDGIQNGETLLRLCLARAPGRKSLAETAAWARLNGVAELCGETINERLHGSVSFFAAITHRLLSARAAPQRLLWSGRYLRIADGSSLSQPGSKGTDWRLHAVYDLGSGGFSFVELTDRKGAESLLRCEPVAGEVLIADRGYAKANALLACLDQSGPHARDFIVRVGWQALVLRDLAGKPFDLIGQMRSLAPGSPMQEWAVRVVSGSASSVPVRLIIVPLPADKAAAARKKCQRRASKHQDKLDPRSLVAAGFMVLVTSLPNDIPAEEICAVYRLRWQIELAFKRLKSLLGTGRLPTRTPAGSLSWLYGHLILLLLTERICQEFLESSP
jgi:hypothetical protein